jgi:hypothetical protein
MEICICGSTCEGCKAFGTMCQGCNQTRGKIFWAKEFFGQETCPLYDCAVNQKHYTDCGQCRELPCQKFIDVKDPGSTMEEHLKGNEIRVGRLKAKTRSK